MAGYYRSNVICFYEEEYIMYVSVLKIKIKLPFSESLKDKRMVKNSMRDKIERTFRVLVKEIDTNDNKKILSLGVIYASSAQTSAEQQINKVLEYMERNYDYEFYEIEKYIEKF
jgi:uncharacterized protein YlxP (DUF503 family)